MEFLIPVAVSSKVASDTLKGLGDFISELFTKDFHSFKKLNAQGPAEKDQIVRFCSSLSLIYFASPFQT